MLTVAPIKKKHFAAMAVLTAQAYPAFGSQKREELAGLEERLSKFLQDTRVSYQGCFDGDKLIGTMRYHDFQLNVRGAILPAGGLGGVAVSLDRKREGAAGVMVKAYLDHYRQRQTPMALLWPFRPDFYRRTGFGYGAKVQRYRWPAASFPDSPLRKQVRQLDESDVPALTECYNSYARTRSGMVIEEEITFKRLFQPQSRLKLFGFEDDSGLHGYLRVSFGYFNDASFLEYDFKIDQIIYNNLEALSGLLGFLYAQKDQVRHVEIITGDEHFHYAVFDPREAGGDLFHSVNHQSNVDGVGIMYRILDFDLLLSRLSDMVCGPGELTVAIDLQDELVPKNSGRRTVSFEKGGTTEDSGRTPDVMIGGPVEHISSLFMGVIPCSKLSEYGLIEVSDPTLLADLDLIFSSPQPPMCITPF